MLCCCCLLIILPPVLYLDDGRCLRLITTLSTTSVTSFMSWGLAEDIRTADRGIPCLSVKICLFALHSLFLSVKDYFQQSSPSPKGDFIDIESIDYCHFQLIPIIPS